MQSRPRHARVEARVCVPGGSVPLIVHARDARPVDAG